MTFERKMTVTQVLCRCVKKKYRHTKSSPIGPAEHDEGGSLQISNQRPIILLKSTLTRRYA